MSRRRSSDGFTLLECEVALLLLSLLVLGLTQLHVSHERLIADVEAWLEDEPTYWVDQPLVGYERVLGRTAGLSTTATTPPGPDATGDYAISPLTVSLDLYPATAQGIALYLDPPCDFGQINTDFTEVLQDVWGLGGTGVTMGFGTYGNGVFAAELSTTLRVEMDVTNEVLLAGTYYYMTTADTLVLNSFVFDLAGSIDGVQVGTTNNGHPVWSVTLLADDELEQVRMRANASYGTMDVRFYSGSCVLGFI